MEDYVKGGFQDDRRRQIVDWLIQSSMVLEIGHVLTPEAIRVQNRPGFEQEVVEYCRLAFGHIKTYSDAGNSSGAGLCLPYWWAVTRVCQDGHI